MMRPRAWAKPERSAAPLPWLRSWRTSSTPSRRSTIAAVPSSEQSSTTMIWSSYGSSRRRSITVSIVPASL